MGAAPDFQPESPPPAPMRLWVTRTQPAAEATAGRLRALGHGPVVSPLLTIRRLRPALNLTEIGALVFTSLNGVAAFAAREAGRGWPVFAVGDATAEAARQAGFRMVRSAAGDVHALAALIIRAHDRRAGPVLIAGAREPAGDLTGALVAGGVDARSAALYAALDAPGRRGLEALRAGRLDGVLIHSPRAAHRLAALAHADAALAAPLASLSVFCISQAAAAPLRALGPHRLAVAAAPDETALLSLLGKPAARV